MCEVFGNVVMFGIYEVIKQYFVGGIIFIFNLLNYIISFFNYIDFELDKIFIDCFN